MNFKFPLIAAFVGILSLTACGGSAQPDTFAASPAQLSKVDSAIGTGADAVAGKTVTVKYTGWLYSTTATGNKGPQFDTGTTAFKLANTPRLDVIAGFDQGVTGMKVGGKRTILIPANLAYGAAGYPAASIPPNSGLVFDVELLKVE
jgi:FKBP-type peptidyl-prolyl cis-trans isomerase FkpA